MTASKTSTLASDKLVLVSVGLGNELIMFIYKHQILSAAGFRENWS